MRNYYTGGNANIPVDGLRTGGMGAQELDFMNRAVETSRGWADAPGHIYMTGTNDPALEEINSSLNWGYAMTAQGALEDENRIFVRVPLPHGVRRGSEIRFYIRFAIEASPGALADKYVYWELQHGVVNNASEVFSAAMLTTVMCKQTLVMNTIDYAYGVLAVGTLVNENVKEDTLYGAHLQRRSSDATNDTYTGKIYILSADAHVYIEKTGTYDEYPR